LNGVFFSFALGGGLTGLCPGDDFGVENSGFVPGTLFMDKETRFRSKSTSITVTMTF